MVTSVPAANPRSASNLVGRRVPGGTLRLEPHESWLLHEAVSSPPRPEPHPIANFVGVQRGMGTSVAGLFELLESDIADGPLLARTTIASDRDLVVGLSYDVEGVVTEVVRKRGATLGAFDLVTVRFSLSESDTGTSVASVTNVYAIRREVS